ncbi:MAG: hypothetical protein ACTSPC_08495 [Candidatus Heimdallarchaeota archaeon]
MKIGKKVLMVLVVFLLSLIASQNVQISAGSFLDSTDDVIHVIDGTYQSIGAMYPEIDIFAIAFDENYIYLYLKTAPTTDDHKRYLIEIYWDQVVTERGLNDNINQTKCYYDSNDYNATTKCFIEGGGNQTFISFTASRTNHIIKWGIGLIPDEYIHNPATVFIKSIYSETLDIPNPNGTIEEYFDFYPDDSQTYYTQATIDVEMPISTFFGFSIIILVIIKRYRKKY